MVRNLETDKVLEESYDKLVFSTGAEPIIPPHVDTALEEVFLVRNLVDAARLKSFLADRKPKEALVVGAGYIGLEMAESLAHSGVGVKVAVRGDRAMSTAEEEISQSIARELQSQGVELLAGSAPQGLERTPEGRIMVHFDQDRSLVTDVVVVGAGVRPRSALAQEAGLDLGVKGAVRVDRRLRTNDPDIFAGGDCAEAFNIITEANTYVPLALGANRQGRVIGDNLAGIRSEFPGILGTARSARSSTLPWPGPGFPPGRPRRPGSCPLACSSKAPSKAHYYPGGGPILTVLIVDRASRPAPGGPDGRRSTGWPSGSTPGPRP